MNAFTIGQTAWLNRLYATGIPNTISGTWLIDGTVEPVKLHLSALYTNLLAAGFLVFGGPLTSINPVATVTLSMPDAQTIHTALTRNSVGVSSSTLTLDTVAAATGDLDISGAHVALADSATAVAGGLAGSHSFALRDDSDGVLYIWTFTGGILVSKVALP